LPPGATHNVYLYLEDKSNNYYFYYTDTHVAPEGFSITRDQIEPLFLELFNFFEKYCDFPERQIYNSFDYTEQSELDARYYNETLWTCSKCYNGNLFEHKHCVFCGADRGF
jgi:hypothetical protein